jgi:hypothetical protein
MELNPRKLNEKASYGAFSFGQRAWGQRATGLFWGYAA